MLSIESFTLGPVATNAYLIADAKTGNAVVIDPGGDGRRLVKAAKKQGWIIHQIWLTHAHFDHLGGVADIATSSNPTVSEELTIALHPADLPLWEHKGGAGFFGMDVDPGPRPSLALHHGQTLSVGGYEFEVRHAPGHTPGHVIFYCQAAGTLFSGDVIFQNSIGRTDLPGGDFETLMKSIREQILTLPDEVRILAGHMGETTVGRERRGNPFLR
ncbi:MAG: Hydroxyacylglutathione hydrolase GloC [Chloroflexi bacterium]|nr:Hydroxyacylglutathione hydrolase GloC [Chloroflexota bacterium]